MAWYLFAPRHYLSQWQQAITWDIVDPILCCHLEPQSQSELTIGISQFALSYPYLNLTLYVLNFP